EEAEVTLVCWGSTYGPAREAVDLRNTERPRANLIHFVDLWPFPDGAAEILGTDRNLVAVEQNYTSQIAQLIRMCTGKAIERTINKYDGRPFSPRDIIAGLD
ncbi:2-oxoacid:acceptor oxidoreductase subunit alpha, partial [Chloroflexota bacterium]